MICGIARRVINPEKGHCLAGYGFDYYNEGVHDDISVTAMFLSDGRQKAFLLSFDLIGMTGEFIAEIRQAVAAAGDISAAQVFLTNTHVHSGPQVNSYMAVRTLPEDNYRRDYNDRLVAWSAEAARDALSNAEECTLHYNFTSANWNMNRRYTFPDRKHIYIPSCKQLAGASSGYVDDELGLVAFKKKHPSNHYKAVLTNYAAHPLCVGGSSNLVTADYQGWIRRTVEQTLDGAMCLTTTGAAGDMHPLKPEAGFEYARQMGTALGSEVLSRLYDAVRVDYDTQVRSAYRGLSLRTRYTGDPPAPGESRRLPKDLPTAETFVSLLGIGPILLAGMPGELLAELGAMLKWSSPFLKTYVLYNATDSLGYIAPANLNHWGGWEIRNNILAPGQAELLIGAALDTARELLADQPLNLPVLDNLGL